MKQIKLLDCTLRDGGYLNDWNFGYDNLLSIFERSVSSKVDFIEVGFLDDRRQFDINRSIMPNTSCIEKIYGSIDKKDAMVVGMIDYGTCSIENIQPCSETYLDGIRVIFKKNIMHEAIAYCKQIKDLGYKVFAQMVSVTSYTDDDLAEFIKIANELNPYAVSMVDTYGLMHQDNVLNIFKVLNENLNPEIAIGYHAHNNFQMGYANCIKMIEQDVDRTILVDGSLYGMGKSAGNAPIELIAMYMNDKFNTNYDINQMLEAIDNNILDFYKKEQWGYNLFYFIAASNHCHPNYVSFLMNKHTLSVKAINEILKGLEGDAKLLYDQKYIERLYLEFQKTTEVNDATSQDKLKNELSGKKVLLVGPGKNINEQSVKVAEFISQYRPIVMPINFIYKNFKADYLFLTNSKRYVQIATKLNDEANKDLKIIATSNVTNRCGSFNYELDYSSLIDTSTEIPDNSLVMAIKMLMRAGVSEIALAGFDGYSTNDVNYFNSAVEYEFAKDKANYLNDYVSNFLKEFRDKVKIVFVTQSKYKN